MIPIIPDLNFSIKELNQSILTINSSILNLNKSFATFNEVSKNQNKNFRDFLSFTADIAGILSVLNLGYNKWGEAIHTINTKLKNFGMALRNLAVDRFNNLKIGILMTKQKLVELGQTAQLAGKVGLHVLKDKIRSANISLRIFTKNTMKAGLEVGKMGVRLLKNGLQNVGRFVAMLYSAVTAQWAFNTAVSANPLGALILGIMAVVGGIILVVKHWDFVKEKIAQFIAWVIENSPFGFIINVIDNIFPGFKDALGGLFDWVVDTFTKIADFIKGIWTSIKSWFGFGDGEEATLTYQQDEATKHCSTPKLQLLYSATSPATSKEVRCAA